MRETVRTYPLLAGFGITAGERMKPRDDEFAKEPWLWKTYGQGILDALEAEPDRSVRLIHRFHQTGQSEILDAWKDYPQPIDLSFKYAIAHMYSSPSPPFLEARRAAASGGTPALAHGAQRRYLQLPLGRPHLRPGVPLELAGSRSPGRLLHGP